MRKVKFHSDGFSLIEFLIAVVAIAGVAAGAIILLNPVGRLREAHDSQRKSDLAQIQKALERYRQDFGRYPVAVSNQIMRSDGGACSGETCAADWGGSLWSSYMSVLPKDPSSAKTYVYSASSNGQAYYLYASLDKGTSDAQACFANGNPCSSAVSNDVSTACGGNCNYGVSSPNVSP